MSEPLRPAFRTVIVDITKLRDYCLSASHPRGRNKARVFRARLGLSATDARLLRQHLLAAVRDHPENLRHTNTDHHGPQYVLSSELSTAAGSATIRSIWIVLAGEDALRLVTCYIP